MRKITERLLGRGEIASVRGQDQTPLLSLEQIANSEFHKAVDWNRAMLSLVGHIDQTMSMVDEVDAEMSAAIGMLLRRTSDLTARYQQLLQNKKKLDTSDAPFVTRYNVWSIIDPDQEGYNGGLIPTPIYDDDFGGYIIPPILDYSVIRDANESVRVSAIPVKWMGEILTEPEYSVWFDSSNDTFSSIEFRAPYSLYSDNQNISWLNSKYQGGHAFRLHLDLGAPANFNELVFRHNGSQPIDLLEVCFNIAPSSVVNGGETWSGWSLNRAAVVSDVDGSDKVLRIQVTPTSTYGYATSSFSGTGLENYVLRLRVKYRALSGKSRVSVRVIWNGSPGLYLNTVETEGRDWEYFEDYLYPPPGCTGGQITVGVLNHHPEDGKSIVLIDSISVEKWLYRYPVGKSVSRSTVVQFDQVIGSSQLQLLIASRYPSNIDNDLVYIYPISRIDVRMRRYQPYAKLVTKPINSKHLVRKVELLESDSEYGPNAVSYYIIKGGLSEYEGIAIAPKLSNQQMIEQVLVLESRETDTSRYHDRRANGQNGVHIFHAVQRRDEFSDIPDVGYVELPYPVYVDTLRIRQMDQELSKSGRRYDPNRLSYASNYYWTINSGNTSPTATWNYGNASIGSWTTGSSTVSGFELMNATASATPWIVIPSMITGGPYVHTVSGFHSEYSHVSVYLEMAFSRQAASALSKIGVLYTWWDPHTSRYVEQWKYITNEPETDAVPYIVTEWDGNEDTIVRVTVPPVEIPEWCSITSRNIFWFQVALYFFLTGNVTDHLVLRRAETRLHSTFAGDGYRPIAVWVKLGNHRFLPDISDSPALGQRAQVDREELKQASSSLISEYYAEEENTTLKSIRTDTMYELRFRHVEMSDIGKPNLKLFMEPKDGSSVAQRIPESAYVIHPTLGVVEIVDDKYVPGYDKRLVASYTATISTPAELVYARRLRFSQISSFFTRNVTDYVSGKPPVLRRVNLNPASEDYYPIIEYYQEGNRIYFPENLIDQIDLPLQIEVEYEAMTSPIRLMAVLTRDGTKTPVLRGLDIHTVEVDRVDVS